MRFERRLVLACGVIAAGALGLWTAPRAAAQAAKPPVVATDITAAEVKAVMDYPPAAPTG
jgi:hypothetical protein